MDILLALILIGACGGIVLILDRMIPVPLKPSPKLHSKICLPTMELCLACTFSVVSC